MSKFTPTTPEGKAYQEGLINGQLIALNGMLETIKTLDYQRATEVKFSLLRYIERLEKENK